MFTWLISRINSIVLVAWCFIAKIDSQLVTVATRHINPQQNWIMYQTNTPPVHLSLVYFQISCNDQTFYIVNNKSTMLHFHLFQVFEPQIVILTSNKNQMSKREGFFDARRNQKHSLGLQSYPQVVRCPKPTTATFSGGKLEPMTTAMPLQPRRSNPWRRMFWLPWDNRTPIKELGVWANKETVHSAKSAKNVSSSWTR